MQGELKSASRCIKFYIVSWVINCMSQWAHITATPLWVIRDTKAKSTFPDFVFLKWGLCNGMTKSPGEFVWECRCQLTFQNQNRGRRSQRSCRFQGCLGIISKEFMAKVEGWQLPQWINSLRWDWPAKGGRDRLFWGWVFPNFAPHVPEEAWVLGPWYLWHYTWIRKYC